MATPVGTGRALGVLQSVCNDLDSLGTTTNSTVGFYGTTPRTRPASASQAAVVTSATATTTVLRAQLTATAVLANALRAALVNVGLIKGAA
jgi:hypothetical protein